MYELTKKEIDEICPGSDKLNKWIGSPFENFIIKYMSTERGKKAEEILSKILSKYKIKHQIMKNNRIGYDFILLNKKIELKYASEGVGGHFTFNQIRVHDNRYDVIIFMFIRPESLKLYYIDKNTLKKFKLYGQHSGQLNACILNSVESNMQIFNSISDGSIEEFIKCIN